MEKPILTKINIWLVASLIIGIWDPSQAFAQFPATGSGHIQPALTSLVLFSFIFTRKKIRPKNRPGSISRERREKENLEAQLSQIHTALNTLFDLPGFPMAKFSLDQGKIIEVNPSLCRALGYTQKELMKKTEWDFFQTGKNRLWLKTDGGNGLFPLVQQSTGKRLNCRILNIVIRREEVPTVISFVSNICESHDLDQV